jgi:hypothetical protein
LADPDAVYETWVLGGNSFEPSVFSNFPFNSFAVMGGQAYAANENGVYLLGGDHDNGEPIRSGARIGPINLGTDGEKRLRGINFGDGGPGTRVRVRAETGEEVYAPERDDNRVVVSRNIQGRTFEIDIMEFIELSHLEISPLRLARR